MITGNPLTEPPHTPFPDPLASSDSEPPPTSAPSRRSGPGNAADEPLEAPEPTTADDLSLILSTSIAKPEPDPMLGSAVDLSTAAREGSKTGGASRSTHAFRMPKSKSTSDPQGLDIGIKIASSDARVKKRAAAESSNDEIEYGDDARPQYSLPTLLLASYASAVTLALVWVLWTGRGLNRTTEPPSATPPAIDRERITAKAPAPIPAFTPVSSLSEDRVTSLGKPIVVGSLEVTPLMVMFQDVRLRRIVDPEGESRDKADCLVLTLRLTNRSSDRTIKPLELASVREGGPAVASFIETANDERIGMLKLAMESEWSIDDQTFPAVRPGGSEDVILVSESVPDRRLAGPLVWRVRLKTEAERTEEIAVRFARQEVVESDPFP